MAKGGRNVSDVGADYFVAQHFHKTCRLWVSLFVVLLSSGACSAKNIPESEEGKCRYDLTSVAALSCMQSDGVWRPPSQTCCNALLYAIDQVPPSHEAGACCLCRYVKEKVGPPELKEKVGPPELATIYVLCNGNDKHIISNWSSFPMECIAECTKADLPTLDMGTSVNGDSDTPVVRANVIVKGIWIATAVIIVMGLICFWYFRRVKATATASEQQKCHSRAGRRRSVVPSPAKLKERRFSSS